MIELEHLTRHFHLGDEEVRALEDVTETIASGEHVAIMGPSGSGKSTLLNLVGCLDRPTSGSYRFDGREVSKLSEGELDRLRQHSFGFIFQAFHLVGRLTARQNVELPMMFAGVESPERRRRADEVLASVGLENRATHRPSELSGGERQRIAIARALALRPTVLLADEPTGNLDRRSGDAILDLLDRLHSEGLTVVVVTHDPRAAHHADRVVLMEDGRIVRRVSRDGLAEALAHWGLEEDER